MRFDFSQIPLKARAFSDKPMMFCDPEPMNLLSAILDLTAVETGNRRARESWQQTQLRNLLAHAAQHSAFWRGRTGGRPITPFTAASLPVLTRADIVRQVEEEGSLLGPGDRVPVARHATSGSSGTPVRFFVSDMNTRYNLIRSTAQFFFEGLDLTRNRTELVSRYTVTDKRGYTVTKTDSWLGALKNFFQSGANKELRFQRAGPALIRELERDAIGYLVAAPWTVEALLQQMDAAALRRAGAVMWIAHGAAIGPRLREAFTSNGIAVRATYSSEEVGLIGAECPLRPDHYHVATSNVLVETRPDDTVAVEGRRLGRILVTHLHSYATPFIRYEVGDLGLLTERCACGHDGPVLSHIHGRGKTLVKRPDGSLVPFYVDAGELTGIARFDEYRIRQTALDRIEVELGGRDSLSAAEMAAVSDWVRIRAGTGFAIEVRAVPRIDWGPGAKRLGFRNEIL